MTETEVVHDPQAGRYELVLAGRQVGVAEYRLRGRRAVFTHTEVDPAYRGRGLGARLVAAALDGAVAAGQEITPVCPFVVAYVKAHPGYLAHLDAESRANLG